MLLVKVILAVCLQITLLPLPTVTAGPTPGPLVPVTRLEADKKGAILEGNGFQKRQVQNIFHLVYSNIVIIYR